MDVVAGAFVQRAIADKATLVVNDSGEAAAIVA